MNRHSELLSGDGSFPICDAHVHCYPAEVSSDPDGFAGKQEEPHWLDLVTSGPQGWADAEQLVRAMDREGIDKAVLLGWYWQNPVTCRLQNTWYSDCLRKFPDRLMAFAAIHPDDPAVTQQLEMAGEWGAIGVGECLPNIQSPDGWQSPGWERIIQWTSEHDWPINLHVTEPVGHAYPGRVDTPLDELVEIFETYPQQKWICSHWGGGLPFFALNKRVSKALRNVWFDSAASPLLYSPAVWKVVVELLGSDKVIFGSDFPLILDPSNDATPNWKRILSQIDRQGFDTAVMKRILSGNILHLASRRA